jgi:hypothetical protein
MIWASKFKLGTVPPTFAEINKAPQKSQKNIKR